MSDCGIEIPGLWNTYGYCQLNLKDGEQDSISGIRNREIWKRFTSRHLFSWLFSVFSLGFVPATRGARWRKPDLTLSLPIKKEAAKQMTLALSPSLSTSQHCNAPLKTFINTRRKIVIPLSAVKHPRTDSSAKRLSIVHWRINGSVIDGSWPTWLRIESGSFSFEMLRYFWGMQYRFSPLHQFIWSLDCFMNQI